ncbi:hypothetical protein [Bdellovibrio bacteriovorus]|uniref:Pilus assembly protein n=1 Tax=Bdellovibrio bacteriovorus TaxID=959 RepID=A0A1Z3NCS6_BDEBC|nr:hypothetical protein [Bdellovibrio bacteriovorus]ASD65274.1 hypothetical protein B9G79_17700 [Bdellovibrio bacteriovorus]
MSRTKSFSSTIQNERGMISAEFIFAIVIAAGLCIVFFALNFTLSMAEVAQYIAFSASRAHAAGHIDQDKQEQMAKDKYLSLINNRELKPLFNKPDGGWFVLSPQIDVRGGGESGRTFDSDYRYTEERVPQVGVRFDFTAKLLSLKVAFLGPTNEDDAGFSAKVTAFLIREPTQKECYELQIKRRYEAVLNLDQRFKEMARDTAGYVPSEDNGC